MDLSTAKVIGTKSPALPLALIGLREADGTRHRVLDVVAEVDEDRATRGAGIEAAAQIHRTLTLLLLSPWGLALPLFFGTCWVYR
jgi:hypothetical protein